MKSKLIAMFLLAASTAVSGLSAEEKCVTHFYSKQPGMKIIINGEFVGQTTNMPLRVDMSEFGSADTWAGGVKADAATCKFNDYVMVKAVPSQGGCVNAESLRKGQNIPKKMYFDADLCPQTPAIDLNVN